MRTHHTKYQPIHVVDNDDDAFINQSIAFVRDFCIAPPHGRKMQPSSSKIHRAQISTKHPTHLLLLPPPPTTHTQKTPKSKTKL